MNFVLGSEAGIQQNRTRSKIVIIALILIRLSFARQGLMQYKSTIAPREVRLELTRQYAMHLYLTSHSPWKTNYTTEDGQVLYKAEAPKAVGPRTISISHVVPTYDKETPSEDMRDQYQHLADVEWRLLGASRIRYQGQDVSVDSYFRKKGCNWYGRNRIFTGQDGKEYLWKMGFHTCKLYLRNPDKTTTTIACFHRKCFLGSLFSKSSPSSLEILPEGEHMVDQILVTFIYVEKLRKERERRRRHSGGGGGP